MTPNLTAAGKNLLLRAIAGDQITFTRFSIGNGNGDSTVENPLMDLPVSKISVGDQFAAVTATLSNENVDDGFHITELGVYAQDPDDTNSEILYALGLEDESTADYVPPADNRVVEIQLDIMVYIGDAENVSAAINESAVYATASELKSHTDNESNPHSVTKEQVGLGNVLNLAIEDQCPSFTEAEQLSEINSQESMSTLFGKIKLAIKKLISHIDNKSNPHGVTADQISAAKKTHTHAASDINSGVLGVLRGGTGCASLTELSSSLIMMGSYGGDGTMNREINIGFRPRVVFVMSSFGATILSSEHTGGYAYFGGLATSGRNVVVKNGDYSQAGSTWNSDLCVLGITENGFKVNHNETFGIQSNLSGYTYMFIVIR